MIKKINYDYIKYKNPTIIFMHGWGMDKSSFESLVHFFYGKYSVLNFDFPNFGLSESADDYFDTYEYAYQIFLLIKSLNINEVVLVGHSFGGRIAILLSTIFDIKIRGCVLTSSAGLTRFSVVNKIKIQAYKLLKSLSNIGLVKKEILSRCGSDDYKKLDDNMRKIFIKIINQDLSFLLDKISSQVYLVWDKKDTITPCWILNKLKKKVRYNKVFYFNCGGHYACFFNKNKFCKILLNMIENDINTSIDV